MISPSKSRLVAEINVVPYIDVMLVAYYFYGHGAFNYTGCES